MSGGNGGGGGDGWRKSTHSTTNGCLEVHMHWRKSSKSFNNGCVEVAFAKSSHTSNGNCVEVEGLPEGWVAVRDGDRPNEVIRISPESWRAFVAGVKDNEFDLA
jgi:hypothetical protein